jgi:hypothetical protein
MAGRKRKPDTERFQELTEQIQHDEQYLSERQSKLNQRKDQRIEVLSHLIVGQMEERCLNYPEVESILTQLAKGEPSKRQLELLDDSDGAQVKANDLQSDRVVQLILRVTEQEKAKIQSNMKKAHYTSFNSYAKKLLLDGYLILWTSPETRELKKELNAANRNLNQLVKRANTTGSIYAGDFQDILSCWEEIQTKTLHYIDQMNRKTHGIH